MHVAVLPRLGELVAADDKHAAIEDKADRVGVGLPISGDGGEAQQPLRLEEGELALGEHHGAPVYVNVHVKKGGKGCTTAASSRQRYVPG